MTVFFPIKSELSTIKLIIADRFSFLPFVNYKQFILWYAFQFYHFYGEDIKPTVEKILPRGHSQVITD